MISKGRVWGWWVWGLAGFELLTKGGGQKFIYAYSAQLCRVQLSYMAVLGCCSQPDGWSALSLV